MHDDGIARIDFMGNYALLAGCLWVAGALLLGGMVMLGNGRVGPVSPAANATPVGEMPATQ